MVYHLPLLEEPINENVVFLVLFFSKNKTISWRKQKTPYFTFNYLYALGIKKHFYLLNRVITVISTLTLIKLVLIPI